MSTDSPRTDPFAAPDASPEAREGRTATGSAPVTAEDLANVARNFEITNGGQNDVGSGAYELAKVRLALVAPRLARALVAERETSARLAILCEHVQADLDATRKRLESLLAERAATRAALYSHLTQGES